MTLKDLQLKFKNFNIGLSDHTNDINSSLSAAAHGACIIEKHFKISDTIRSLDSKFSINPKQLKILKERSMKIFLSLGISKIGLKNAEKNSLAFRRSLFAIRDIKKGDKLTKKNIKTFRPMIGIGAEHYFSIIGKKVNKNIKKSSPIFKSNLII